MSLLVIDIFKISIIACKKFENFCLDCNQPQYDLQVRREGVEIVMMQLVFTHVPAAGFSAFRADLSNAGWLLVKTSDYEGPDRTAAKSFADAPLLVVIKLRTTWGITNLEQAIEGAGSAKNKDGRWDGCQKHLQAVLGAAASSNDPAKRDAAGRLQKMLLLGGGIAQTKLRYQQEVDFGRKQVTYVSHGQGLADIGLLGLSPVMSDIHVATTELAEVIGHGEGAQSPYNRKLAATAECAATFSWAAQLLGWLVEHGSPGAAREQAMALRAPFEELAARYPAPANTGKTQSAKAAPLPS